MTDPRATQRRWLALPAAILAATLVAGCASYRCGSTVHPQLGTIAVGRITNMTDEPRQGLLCREMLLESFMLDGSLRVVPQEEADAILNGSITRYRLARKASAKRRKENARDHDRDAYQTTVYSAEVTLALELTVPGRKEPLKSQTVVGQADFPRLPDFVAAKEHALQQALGDAACKAVASVTEAW